MQSTMVEQKKTRQTSFTTTLTYFSPADIIGQEVWTQEAQKMHQQSSQLHSSLSV